MLTRELSKMSPGEMADILGRTGVDLAGPLSIADKVIRRVRAGGDAALMECAREYDRFSGERIEVTESDIRAARARLSDELLRAMKVCKSRIEAYHSRQVIQPFEFKDRAGRFGQKVVPIDRVGVYVPGGTASYASSVLMACVPARVAGVEEIALCSPAKGDKVGDAVLAAAGMCGVDEVYAVGGAHAVAAMAYGTESIRRVRKIVGPGGAVVSAAKLLVRNDCEIDSLAGPSEVLLIADGKADPRLLAAEMLAQLEHDTLARAILVSSSKRVLSAARKELTSVLGTAQRRDILERSSKEGAVFLLAEDLAEALDFANEYSPEHLYLDVSSPETALKSVRNAGSVFLGRSSSVAFGDYCAGPNHILPTMGTASARSSLSTYDFQKVVPYQSVSASGARELADVAETMASAEGLPAHARAAAMRREVMK